MSDPFTAHVEAGQVVLRLGSLVPGEVTLSPGEAARLVSAILALAEVPVMEILAGDPDSPDLEATPGRWGEDGHFTIDESAFAGGELATEATPEPGATPELEASNDSTGAEQDPREQDLRAMALTSLDPEQATRLQFETGVNGFLAVTERDVVRCWFGHHDEWAEAQEEARRRQGKG